MTSAADRRQVDRAELLALWQLHGHDPRAPERLAPPLRRAIRAAAPESVEALLEQVADDVRDRERLLHAVAELQAAHDLLEQKIDELVQPPLPVARLCAFDPSSGQAWIATSPTTRSGVAVQGDVDTASLVEGTDVVLTAERNCILGVLPRSTPPGSARVLTFCDFLEGVPRGALRPALASDGSGEVFVRIPADLETLLLARLADGRQTIRLCVDEFGQAFALCGQNATEPRAAAARFRLPLEPITAAEVVGLDEQRRRIDDAVARVATRGAFVLCEGPTGIGKTHLARYALARMQQRGETVVLGLRSSADHRYYGQEENDVENLFLCARALVADGRQVLVFVDEIDKHFYRSRFGESVHVNSTRATWLAHLGDGVDPRGMLIYGTTNKAGHLPDELLNRVTHPLSFTGLDRVQVRGLLDMYLAAPAVSGANRARILEAIAEWIHDGLDGSVVAVVTLRDQTRLPLYPRDLRQLSARFCRELALRLGEEAATGQLEVERALLITNQRLREVVQGLGLAPHNVAERTFVEFSPRNPAESVRCTAPRLGAERVLFRYRPLEIDDE